MLGIRNQASGIQHCQRKKPRYYLSLGLNFFSFDGTATTAAATTCTLLLPGGSYTKTPTYACPAGQQRSTACKNYLIPTAFQPTLLRHEPSRRLAGGVQPEPDHVTAANAHLCPSARSMSPEEPFHRQDARARDEQ